MTSWDGTGVDPWLPQRLAAEAAITAAERRLYQAWWGSFSAWLVTVHRSVLGTNTRPDASAVWAHAPLWAEKMTSFVQGPVKDTMAIAYARLLGKDYQFDARPFVSTYLAQVHNRMVRTPDEVFDLVASSVARGAAQGEGIPQIAERVDEVLTATATERWPSRAVTVARTEAIGAWNGSRTDSFHAFAEATGEELEQQWLCVAPDTPVATTTAVHAARRRYVGTLVRITTASGRSVAVTPKHRVLTGRGWLPAQSVHEGDHLFQVVGTEPARAPNVQRRPTGLGELVDAAMQAESVKVRTVPVAVDLDGEAGDREIQVVPANGDLSTRLQASIPEGGVDLFLAPADLLTQIPLLAKGNMFPRFLGHRLSQQGSAGGSDPAFLDGGRVAEVGEPAVAARGHLLVFPGRADLPGGALVAEADASLFEDGGNGRARAPERLGDRLHRRAGAVHGHDGVSVQVVPPPGLDGEALRCAGLLDRPRPVPESALRGLGVTEQDATLRQRPTDGHRADRQVSGYLGGRLASLIAPDHRIDVERPPVVSGWVTPFIAQDREHTAPADPEHANDGGRAIALIEQPQHFRSQTVPAASGLPGRRLVPQRDPRVGEALPQRAGSHAEVGAQLLDRCARLVTPDEVVDIDVTAYEGQVYDLSTGTGWYLADGLIIHNSTLDGRTRPDHLDADGQRVPLGQPFIVGGEALMHPGDPTGSASNIINCRCTSLALVSGETVDETGRPGSGTENWDTWEDDLDAFLDSQ